MNESNAMALADNAMGAVDWDALHARSAAIFDAVHRGSSLALQSGLYGAPPVDPAQAAMNRYKQEMPPQQVRGPIEAIKDAYDVNKPLSPGGALNMLMTSMGRMPAASARTSIPVVPLRPYKPNTTFTGEPPTPSNMNPPPKLNWTGPNDSTSYFGKPPLPPDPIRGEPGPSFATTDKGHNLAIVTDKWNWNDGQGSHYTYQPRIHKPVPNGTTEAHAGPEFRSREVAQQYAEALLKSGKYGAKPDPAFAAPFLEQDAAALRQVMAEKTRSGFGVVEE